jgi:hypothetical protein
MRLYCAAPMRKIPQHNHPAIHAAVTALRAAGHEVFSPAEQDLDNGKDPADGEEYGNDPAYLRIAMAVDLGWITANADAVVVLPGWGASKGAQAEVHTALAVGIPVYRLAGFLAGDRESEVSWEQLHPALHVHADDGTVEGCTGCFP